MDKLITAEMIAGCEREDLRHSGAIMSHGALLHVSAEGQVITHVSENIAAFCGLTPQQVLDRPLAQSGIAVQLEPALIVTDIVMPGGVDGWDLADLLRLTGPKVPIILMTGFSRKVVERNRTLPANVIGYLEKPFRESDLQALLPAIAPNAGAVPSA